MMPNIKRIFFDSGLVLVYPKSGEWFYTNAYKHYCKQNALPERTFLQNLNYKRAYKYLASIKSIKDEQYEYEVFSKFYEIVFSHIKGKNNKELIDICANSKVKDYSKYSFYSDVKDGLQYLGTKYKLGIISDAWPSLLGVYRQENVLSYFDPFIISSIYGCTKEGYELFKIALGEIVERPEECLFVDDSYGNCMRASKLGMNVLLMDRNKNKSYGNEIEVISSMNEMIGKLS